jgi:mono/diheme cytochrome c family protein
MKYSRHSANPFTRTGSLAALAALLLIPFSGVGGTAQTPGALPSSVWNGVYSAEQAESGSHAFAENCSSCHGEELQGTADAKALKGDKFWTDWRETTVDYMLERISKSMPFSEDGSLAGTLSEQTYADIVAHILQVNGFPAGKTPLTRESSLGVAIIRKEGPGELPDGTLARVEGCLTRTGNGPWRLTRATAPLRVHGGLRATGSAAGNREYELKFVLTPLDKFAGHRLAITGLLMGDGGKNGVNLSSSTSLSQTCE